MVSMRSSVLLGVLAVLVARPSMAGEVTPGWCVVPSHIALVGSQVGRSDEGGQFTVVVTRFGNPVNAAAVVIDYSNCTDLVICSAQLDPGVTVGCATDRKYVRKFTDMTGTVSFTVLGGSNGTGNATTLPGGARIYANGVLIGSPSVSAYDLDGVAGVGINDLAVWMNDFGSGETWGRSDLDGSGTVGINDLAMWLEVYGAGTSSVGCANSCP